MKFTLTAGFVLLTILSVSAQIKYGQDSLQNQTEAFLTLEDSESPKRIYIRSYVWTPWEFQKEFLYIDADYYDELIANDEKVKGKYFDKVKSKEASKLSLFNGEEFVQMTYADLTELGMASLPQKYLLHRVVDGDMSIYVLYQSKSINIFKDYQKREAIADTYEFIQRTADILIKVGDEKLKSVKNIKLQELTGDQPELVEKLKQDEYADLAKYQSMLHPEGMKTYKDLESFIQFATEYNKN